MDFSKLSYGEILARADTLRNSSAQMESLLNELKATFDKVGNDDVWSGTAASQTKEVFDQLSAKFPEFATAVNDCANHLQSVVANYQAVDQVASVGQ